MSTKEIAQLAVRGGQPACPFDWPAWPVHGPEEEQSMLAVLNSGQWWYGERVQQFESEFASFQGASHCVSCTNGTTALEMGLRALGVTAGDEVIVPCYSFIATASAVITIGAIPVFADIDPETLCIDPTWIRNCITSRTKAIIPVHVAGRIADMDRINQIAAEYGLAVLEDAAHAWGSRWGEYGAGTLGSAGTFSFQVSKNLTAGEGGALVTNDAELADLCRSYSHCGRTAGGAWYDHDRLGSNLRITEFQAALLSAQLTRLPQQLERRDKNVQSIEATLRTIHGVKVIATPSAMSRRSHHFLPFRLSDLGEQNVPPGKLRSVVIAALNAEGIPATAGWYRPLYRNGLFQRAHMEPRHGILAPLAGMGVDYRDVNCPVCEAVCHDTIWLPQHLLLADEASIACLSDGLVKVLGQLPLLITLELESGHV